MTFEIFRWIQAAKKKDREAFDSLFQIFYQDIKRYCYSISRDNEDAEDRVSQTYINAWQNIHTLRGVTTASVRKWLRTIALRVELSDRRQSGKQNEVVSLDARNGKLLETQPADVSSMEQDVFSNSYAQQLLDAIRRKLREKGNDEYAPAAEDDYKVFICRYYEEMEYSEIANIFDHDAVYWRQRYNTTIEPAVWSALLELAFRSSPGISHWKNPDYSLFWRRLVKGQTFEEAAKPLKQTEQTEKLWARWHKTICPIIEQSGFVEAARNQAGHKWNETVQSLFLSRTIEGLEYCHVARTLNQDSSQTADTRGQNIHRDAQASLSSANPLNEASLQEMWQARIKPVVEATLIEFSKR